MSNVMPEADLQKRVDNWKNVEGSLIMMLHAVQDQCGYVPRQTAMELSRLTEIPLAKIYEVLTFYHFFKLTAPAKNKISVCTGTACYLKGSQSLMSELEKELGISEGGTTADGRFSINAVRCMGCCALAPVMSVNGKIYGQVKPADIPSILREVTKGEEERNG
jgi:NADH-quinone oxidoreductase subunit E